MRYFFAIVVGSMMLGCTERNNQHVELRSGEAAEASRLIKSLGGACTTRFDVASFCGRLHTASANVTSKLERLITGQLKLNGEITLCGSLRYFRVAVL